MLTKEKQILIRVPKDLESSDLLGVKGQGDVRSEESRKNK